MISSIWGNWSGTGHPWKFSLFGEVECTHATMQLREIRIVWPGKILLIYLQQSNLNIFVYHNSDVAVIVFFMVHLIIVITVAFQEVIFVPAFNGSWLKGLRTTTGFTSFLLKRLPLPLELFHTFRNYRLLLLLVTWKILFTGFFWSTVPQTHFWHSDNSPARLPQQSVRP